MQPAQMKRSDDSHRAAQNAQRTGIIRASSRRKIIGLIMLRLNKCRSR